jgi:alkylation response protein AidB-like acyl-CoA dehydrogenase
MRFDLTEEQEMVRETARRFLEKAAPLTTVRQAFDSADGFSGDTWREECGLGWVALAAPESAGGFSASGAKAQDLAIVAEEMGRLIGAGPFIPAAVVLDALTQAPDPAAHGPLMERVVAGEAVVAWAFGEAGDRWDPEVFDTRARIEGDTIILEGAKAYVEAGAQAQALLVTARTDEGVLQALVPADAPGVTVIPSRGVDFVRRFAEVRLEAVRLPISALVSAPEQGAAQVERQLQLALLLQCAETNGAVERAFEFTVDYMRDRIAFGRAIASYQALKHRLADMLLRIHSCMATTDAGLEAFDASAPDAGRLARVAKAYVASKSTAIVSDLVQLTGGIGVTWDHDLHIYERRIAVNRAIYGTPERRRAELHRMIFQ